LDVSWARGHDRAPFGCGTVSDPLLASATTAKFLEQTDAARGVDSHEKALRDKGLEEEKSLPPFGLQAQCTRLRSRLPQNLN
jgi:hypothetical protein